MGTKENPGKYDCYANAKPDEPVFVLLGRDPCAPTLVALWALLRRDMGEDPAMVKEAFDISHQMQDYATVLGKRQKIVEAFEAAKRVIGKLG